MHIESLCKSVVQWVSGTFVFPDRRLDRSYSKMVKPQRWCYFCLFVGGSGEEMLITCITNISHFKLASIASGENHLQWKCETMDFGRSAPASLTVPSCLLHSSVRSYYTGSLATISAYTTSPLVHNPSSPLKCISSFHLAFLLLPNQCFLRRA